MEMIYADSKTRFQIQNLLYKNGIRKQYRNYPNLGFIGKTYTGDVGPTMKTFDWKPYDFESTVIDTAKSVQEAMNK